MVCFVVTQHSETELSLCLRYSKNSSISDAIHNKVLPKSEVLERILVKDFYLKIIISDQRPYFIKDFLQRFLALAQPQKNICINSV